MPVICPITAMTNNHMLAASEHQAIPQDMNALAAEVACMQSSENEQSLQFERRNDFIHKFHLF